MCRHPIRDAPPPPPWERVNESMHKLLDWAFFSWANVREKYVKQGENKNRSGSYRTGRFAGSMKNRSVRPVFTGSIAGTIF
jgi:hypothetical protein